MSTSWNATTSDIINRALRIVGALPTGNSPSNDEYNNAKYALNSLVKRISVDGVKLWTLEEIVYAIPTVSAVSGSDGNNYFAIKNHVSSNSNKPITGTEYTDNWALGADTTTTAWVSGSNYTSSNILSLSGQYQGIDSAFYRENNVDYPLQIISLQDYFSLEDKFVRCTVPTHISIDANLSGSSINIYPYPYTATGRIHILAVRYIQDFVNTTDNPDLPIEWVEALTYMLSALLADEYRKDLDERSWLQNKAESLYRRAMGNDRTIQDTMVVRGGYSNRRR